MEGPVCPVLPNELWIRILRSLDTDDDLSFLWITCRNVSSTFKDATECIFRERLLPYLRINFLLGEYTPPVRSDRRFSAIPLTCEFEFDRLSEDKYTATLSLDKEITEEMSDDLKYHSKRLRQVMGESHIEMPKHTIQIRREVNDGPIPSVAFNYDKLQLSCDWRALFSEFYGEEFLYHKFSAEAASKKLGWLKDLREKVDRKEIDAMAVIQKALHAFADDSSIARKMARRARVTRQFAEWNGTEWDFARDGDEEQEEGILKNLQQFRQWASLGEWSDDEEADEDDSEEDDDDSVEEGSGEGWETDDDEGSAEDD
ncbi:uncharacterized protein PAC_05580 [Phialocephala subalpina]|uniref:Uncharacterized protein n=1 Tax=Phialocephala subalpina TaxID=576137 RepID=A0A1L7WSE2_9HELO|nr:uncharacterized protein PAC_05580 [Phialocephala subalpina]